MTDKPKSCRSCKHCGVVEQATKLVCRWEQSFLPPPVMRDRLWGKDAPETWGDAALTCQHYAEKDT
jgi:hypothetical protein